MPYNGEYEGECHMKKRTLEILSLLARNHPDNTVAKLAKHFSVSERTIRNDLHDIDDYLMEQGQPPLQMTGAGEIQLPEGAGDLSSLTGMDNLYAYKLSPAERRTLIKILLLRATQFITLSEIADRLLVSRVTIIGDMDRVKAGFEASGLKVGSYSNKGLLLEGSEGSKRKVLMTLISQEYKADRGESIIIEFVRHLDNPRVGADDMAALKDLLTAQERSHGAYLTDRSFEMLLIYLLIAITRIREGSVIPGTGRETAAAPSMAADILNNVAQYWNVEIAGGEITFLQEILKSLKYTQRKSRDEVIIKLQLKTRQFIERISQTLQINLNHDFEFYQNLSNHIESVVTRRFEITEPNEVVSRIVADNPVVLAAVRENIDILENHTGRTFSPVELDYIVIHICAALERRKKNEVDFHVVVVCGAGVGTSQLILAKLKNHFDFHIDGVAAAHDLADRDLSATDLIISTVPLKNQPCAHVVVSPLFSDEDYLTISREIGKLQHTMPGTGPQPPRTPLAPQPDADSLIAAVEAAFDRTGGADPATREAVLAAIRECWGEKPETSEAPTLYELLPPDHIRLGVDCYSWRDAIRQAAIPLLKKGYIEERYIDAMIDNVVENGPYIVISPGFALPHEGYGMGSLKVGMNLIRLAEPVDFSEPGDEPDPVEFVCCLSAVDHEQHMRAFFHLANLLTKPDFKQGLRDAATPEEIHALIKTYELRIRDGDA